MGGKDCANLYGSPWVIRNGRNNDVNVCCYAVEFLEEEKDESVVWFLQRLKETVRRSPKMFGVHFFIHLLTPFVQCSQIHSFYFMTGISMSVMRSM